jgi:hypothetical protein
MLVLDWLYFVSYFIATFFGVLVGVIIFVSAMLVKDDSVELIYRLC